jgi:hypothetical protein
MTNADPNIQLMLDCVHDTGDELVERWGWQDLKTRVPVTFTGDGTTAAFTPPPILSRLGRPTLSFRPPIQLSQCRGRRTRKTCSLSSACPLRVQPSCWSEVNGLIEFYPVLPRGEVVSYVYAQNSWVLNSGGVPYNTPTFMADTDTFVFPERLLRMGGIWRWKAAKGLQYAERMEDYEKSFTRLAGQEETTRVRQRRRFGSACTTPTTPSSAAVTAMTAAPKKRRRSWSIALCILSLSTADLSGCDHSLVEEWRGQYARTLFRSICAGILSPRTSSEYRVVAAPTPRRQADGADRGHRGRNRGGSRPFERIRLLSLGGLRKRLGRLPRSKYLSGILSSIGGGRGWIVAASWVFRRLLAQ